MVLLHLALTFAMLSLLAVDGGTAVLPEMQSILLHEFDLTHDRFVHIYSLGQLAPSHSECIRADLDWLNALGSLCGR
jgi:chromate transport protein ChrA